MILQFICKLDIFIEQVPIFIYVIIKTKVYIFGTQ